MYYFVRHPGVAAFTSDRCVGFLPLKVVSSKKDGNRNMMRHGTSSASAHYARSKELVARLHQWHFHVLVLLQLPLSYLQHLPGHAKMSAQVLIFHQSEKHLKSKRTPKMVSLRIIMTCATRKVELNVQHLFSHRGDTEGIPRYLGVPTQNC